MNTQEQDAVHQAVIERLKQVIDPETNADVIRMRLVEHLSVDPKGRVSYTFRPSSPFCPIAVFLAQQIKQAVAEVPGIASQQITVEDYVAEEQLTQLINKEN